MSGGGKTLNTRASGIVAAAVMCSRVLGLVREMLFAGLFGSKLMGLFIVAYRIPNLLRDLFAEGALSTAFVTVFSAKIEREGLVAAWRLAAKVFTLAAVFMTLVSALGIIFSHQIASLLAWNYTPEQIETVTYLTRIMFPFILLVSLAALAMGMLNSVGVFGIPAMASSFYNIGSIVGGCLLGWWLDPSFGVRALAGLAVGSLIGGFLQFAVQVPRLWREGFRFLPDFRWRDSGVRTVLVLMLPSVIAAGAVQINVMINTGFASFLGPQAVSWLNFSFRLMQLPLGVFGVAVATITLPVLARIAASADLTTFGTTVSRALRLIIFFTLPAALGLYLLAEPIISLIYQRGVFLAEDSHKTALALQCYAVGLIFYSGIKVISPAFYTINRKWIPMCVSFAVIGCNILLNWFFIFRWGFDHRGLALATSLSALLNFSVLYFLLHRVAGRLEDRAIVWTLLRCGAAAAVMGLVCWLGTGLLGEYLAVEKFIGMRICVLMGLIALGAGVYIALCFFFRVEEVREAGALLKRKFSR